MGAEREKIKALQDELKLCRRLISTMCRRNRVSVDLDKLQDDCVYIHEIGNKIVIVKQQNKIQLSDVHCNAIMNKLESGKCIYGFQNFCDGSVNHAPHDNSPIGTPKPPCPLFGTGKCQMKEEV